MLAEVPQEDVRLVLSCSALQCVFPLRPAADVYQPQAPWCRRPSGAFRERASSWTSALCQSAAERRFMSLPVAERSEAASTRRRRRSAKGTLPGRCAAAIRRPSGRRQLASRSVRDVTCDCFNQCAEMSLVILRIRNPAQDSELAGNGPFRACKARNEQGYTI